MSGSLILTEEWGTNLVVYLYDNNGAPIGMRYRTSSMAEGVFYTFWFERNLQGDVVAVYNETGTKVRSYTYDAWGNKTTTIHNSSGTNSYAQYNAITYRGYYFDSETNLYYVSSRYYDAKIGRFVNADSYMSTGQGILSNNMYSYCCNTPIMMVDSDGEFGILASIAIGAAVGAASQFISGVVSNALDGKRGSALFTGTGTIGEYATSTLSGALCAIPGAGAAVSVVCDVVSPAVQQAIDCAVYDNVDWSWSKYGTNVASNLVCNWASSAISVETPRYIRDIKAEAGSLGKKGAKKLTSYLKKSQNKAFLTNQAIGIVTAVSGEVYKKSALRLRSLR